MSDVTVPMIALLVVVALGLLTTRVASVALMFTGLSRELARFQSLSAFMGVGFTTSESECVVQHPVRRRIIKILILLGNAGFIAGISAMLPVFISGEQDAATFFGKLGVLAFGLILLAVAASSKWLDRQLSRLVEWALRRWTKLDVWDYPDLLQLGSGYSVCRMAVEAGNWVEGKTLGEVRLGDEGVQVLGIRRATGDYVGAPIGTTQFRAGDNLVVYGKTEHVAELDHRRAGTGGDKEHIERVAELHRTVVEQESEELRALRQRYTDEDYHDRPAL